MTALIQALWDQMRADFRAGALPQLNEACHSLGSGSLGPLTEHQIEDLRSVERSITKLTRRAEGEPIDWNDYSEAAHALRGPLNSTIGFSRLMLKGIDGPINEAQTEALETIYGVSRRLLVHCNLLLDALLLADDAISFDIEPVQFDEILEELIATGYALADSRGFVFRANVAAQVKEATVKGDAKRLKQALSSLLAASVKYMGDGVVTLQTELHDSKLLIQLDYRACRLPTSLLADLSVLLTDGADDSFPYDAHLRLGLAWRLLTRMNGHLEARQTGETCAFTVTLPVECHSEHNQQGGLTHFAAASNAET